MQIEANVIVCS